MPRSGFTAALDVGILILIVATAIGLTLYHSAPKPRTKNPPAIDQLQGMWADRYFVFTAVAVSAFVGWSIGGIFMHVAGVIFGWKP